MPLFQNQKHFPSFSFLVHQPSSLSAHNRSLLQGVPASPSHWTPIDSFEIYSQPENKLVKLPVTCFLEKPGLAFWGMELPYLGFVAVLISGKEQLLNGSSGDLGFLLGVDRYTQWGMRVSWFWENRWKWGHKKPMEIFTWGGCRFSVSYWRDGELMLKCLWLQDFESFVVWTFHLKVLLFEGVVWSFWLYECFAFRF